ncbi:LPS-assembly protein LptD [Achromobacter deleyi]|uniref:LPS-assembly protein LptD n=1 Tax=Achromobacter deleyi TaxID=1353891 RepID=A0A6S7ANU5_9BURK|nr:LPS-assembly protein LptD [Achromobacter deleyi]CAB3817411.1 LPS-assembly protein LptD [Achromobacter deleyi]CAB3858253.1 LPS-assembly protein LptD [Achromobacter deleyi]CAB3870276.1 LPS-assembly protein LptD [Achromobacter deleyi]
MILSAISVAGAAQAQGSQGSAPSSTSITAAPELRTSPGLRMHRLPDGNIPAYMEADTIEGDPDSDLTLTGAAQVRRIDGVIKGDRINYRKDTGDVDVQGNARMMRDGTLVTGPTAKFNVDKYSGEVEKPNFWLGATGGFAVADKADIFSKSQMRLHTVTYSGCACETPSWYIKANTVDIDFDENEGVARSGVLYFKDVPILASPYMTFPVKKERKSGFLMPTYGTTSKGGFDFSLPYYLNIAPNYDATIQPRYFSKRGLQMGGEFRYLGWGYNGTVDGAYLPNDNVSGNDRWMYWWRHQQLLSGGFYADWDIAKVSDDDYFRDISQLGLNQASTTYLPQRARVGWASTYWSAYAQVYKYQTLQDPDALLAPPYDKEPELYLRGARYDWGGFDVDWTSTAVRFSKPLLLGNRNGPNGDRLQTYPTVSYPIVRPGWFVVPKVGVNYTQYQTSWYNGDWNRLNTDPNSPNFNTAFGYPRSQSRTVPIMSLDAGLIFERDTTLFGKASTQTLEPRLYYLRVPYRDQSKIPVYDTSLSDFSFSQAFDENIYTGGWDRISNANQLTAALTTRWLDASTGFERASLAVAQRLYFADQQVTLPGETPRENVRSDFLVGASAALTDTFSTDVAAQYNPYDNRWSRTLLSGRWSPQRLTTIALAYRYQRDPQTGVAYQPQGQNQISLAVQWPFTKRWYGVGRVDYSLRNGPSSTVSGTTDSPRITQAIAGLEYKGNCCWVGRMVFQRYAVSATDANTALFFQLELTGLGSLGTDPMNLLNRSIPGYSNITPPVPTGTTFERYE